MKWHGQALRDIIQTAVFFMVAVLFLVWFVFGSTTIDKQNQTIISHIRADLLAHAEGSQDRQCAIATELEFFFSHPAKVNGQKLTFTRPTWQLKRLAELKKEACTLNPLP